MTKCRTNLNLEIKTSQTIDSQDNDSNSLPIAEEIFDEDELDQLYEAVIGDEWSKLMTVEEFLAVFESWFETSH